MKPYIALIRDSENFDELVKRRPTAFVLLTLIAKRARRTDTSNFDDLEIGEALIGDYETYGSTERKYRTDKDYLEKYHFSTFRSTSRGTVAKLVDTSIFDPNFEISTNKLTGDRRTSDEQATTNKNEKKEKNEKNIYSIQNEVVDHYNLTYGAKARVPADGKGWVKNFEKWSKDYSIEEIKEAITNSKKDSFYGDKLTLDMLFRSHEDRIGKFLDQGKRVKARKSLEDLLKERNPDAQIV